jgi:hypothetical protein
MRPLEEQEVRPATCCASQASIENSIVFSPFTFVAMYGLPSRGFGPSCNDFYIIMPIPDILHYSSKVKSTFFSTQKY